MCLVSAVQLLAPRNMPFGITEPSPVVAEVQKSYSLDLKTYPNESALTAAAEQGDIYGGYIVGRRPTQSSRSPRRASSA